MKVLSSCCNLFFMGTNLEKHMQDIWVCIFTELEIRAKHSISGPARRPRGPNKRRKEGPGQRKEERERARDREEQEDRNGIQGDGDQVRCNLVAYVAQRPSRLGTLYNNQPRSPREMETGQGSSYKYVHYVER